jgi:hypothetical protein
MSQSSLLSALNGKFAGKLFDFIDKVQNLIDAIRDGQDIRLVRELALDTSRNSQNAERGEMGLLWGSTKMEIWVRDVSERMSEICRKLHGNTPPADVLPELELIIQKASPLIFT